MQPPPALNATEPPDELFVPVALLPALPTLELGGLGMADVELTALSVAGLDSVEALSLTLEGERSILASATLGPLSLRARAWLTVTPPMPTDRQWRGEVDACDCGWTSRWACPTASPQEGQQVAENDGTACFAYCCRPPGLDQEVEIEASLEGAHAEAILALDPSAQALAVTSLQTAAARPECALAALGVAPRHISLTASPARLRLRYAAVPSDGGDVLGSAVLAATSHALDFAIGSSAPGAIKDALDAFVSGLALEALEAFITRADHETCATSSPPASLADGGDGGAGTKASGLWRSQGGAGGREGAGEDDTGTGRRDRPDRVARRVVGGRAALVQAGSGWANETERQAAFAAATSVADDRAATEAAARANLALRALGVDELAVGEIASLSLVAPLATPAPLQLGLSDLRLSGVAAASELSFLAAECEASDGVDPFSGGTALYATKARAAVATSEPLSLSMALSISLLGRTVGWTVNLTAAAVTAEAVQQLRLAAGALGALSIADLASPCVLTPLRGARLDALDGGASSFELAIAPINGTEPAVLTAGFLGSLLSAVLPGTLGALNEALASTVDAAHEACAAPRVGVPPAAATTTTGTGMSGLETLLSCTVYGAAYGISALVIGGHLACPRFCCVPRRGAAADGGAFPIASHYPRSLTWPLSLLLVLNLLLFSYANAPVLDGAMVRATVSVAGAPLPPLDVFGIGLPSSVIRFWQTGGMGYLISALIVVFSGIWPAVKLSTTLFCLWAPPCVLPAGRRGALLGFFEKMGKWSNVDSLMIFILMAAMQMDFTLPPAPEPGALPLATVSVEVMPTEGITYFFLAVLASLLLTALVFHMHKTVCLPPQHPCARPPREATRAGQGTRKAAVRPGTEAAAPPIPSVALRHRSGERFGIVVSLSLIFAFCATLGACFLPVFRLSKGGLLGVALGGESSDEYSVIESGVQLRHASPSSPDWLMEGCRPVSPLVSLAWLSRPELPSRYRVIYFLVIMVAPLAWYFGCLLAWFVPLSPSSRHAAGFMLNVCSSLGALEVYVVCMILSIVQLDAIAQQIVGEISHGLCDTVGAVAEAHFAELVDPPTCLTLSAGIRPPYFLLTLATLVGIPAGLAVASRLDESALEMPPLAWGTFDDSSAEDKAATRKSSASETRNGSRTGGAHQPSTNIV
mmetsp:Transcript_25047/g.72035  ORF Transcript_25047/g.72035 Transcript_25047/m.72035 type:complete len:1162 (-) Transcript_25047:299-3784(-)